MLLTETAPRHQRGREASLVYVGAALGSVLGALVWILVQLMPAEQVQAWGWRIVFLSSIVVTIAAYIFRRMLNESPVFEEAKNRGEVGQEKTPIAVAFKYGWKGIVRVICLTLGAIAHSYFYQVFVGSYVVDVNPGGVAGGSGCQYFVGDFDGSTFTPDAEVGLSADRAPGLDDPLLRAYDWFDFGRDCYAVTSFADVPDGRRIVLGWMNNWDYAADVPLTGGRSIMTIPRELELVRLAEAYVLRQRPVRELPASGLETYTLADGDRVSLRGVALEYHNGVLSLDRRGVGHADFHEGFGTRQWAEIPERPGSVTVEVLIDSCSIEVFAAAGLVTISDLVFF